MVADVITESFVGRRRELTKLHQAFSDTADGQGRVVVLVGEPGIGKTRTIEEFAAWARHAGAEVLVGRCYEGDGAPAFWPWLQVLRAYVAARDAGTLAAELGSGASGVAAFVSELHAVLPDLLAPPILAPEQARFHFFDAVTTCLKRAAEARPLILVLDDLHGADQPSLLLLQFLAREVHQARILVVGGHRDVGLDHPLAETLGELAREPTSEWVRLGGLTVPEVAALLTTVAGTVPTSELIAAVHERTGGNPLYVVEVARSLDAVVMAAGRSTFEIPESVRIAILRRLEILSSECLETVMLASFFGREFGAAALARASDVDVARVLELLDEAATARIVAPEADPSRWRFTHALFGEVLAQAAPAARRVAVHRRAAEALAADAAAEEKAAEIAHHWLAAGEAGDPEQAVAWACRAGDRALGVLAYEEAVRQYRRALTAVAWLDGRGAPREADVLLALGEAHKLAGEHEAAKTVFQRAAARARFLGSPELLTRAALGFAPTLVLAERPEVDPAVASLLEEAIAGWDGRDGALHARALARLGMSLLFGDVERRWGLLDTAFAMARRVGDAATLRYVLACKLSGRRRLDALETDLAVATELVDSAARAGDMEPLLHGRLARLGLLLEQGDLFAADREAALFTRLTEELRQPVWRWLAKNLAGSRAIRDGRFEDAERELQDAVAFGQTIVPFAASSYYAGTMILLRTLQGKMPEVMPMFRALAETHPDPAAVTPIAWAESELGEEEAACQRVKRLGRFDRARDALWMLPAGFLGATCANLDDVPLCATWYENLLPYAGRWIAWVDIAVLWPVDQMLAALARVLGRFDAGIAHAESALAAATAAGARPCVARVQYELARLLRARDAAGDATRAGALLTAAKAGADHLGMAALPARIVALGEVAEEQPADGAREISPHTPSIFRQEGDYWTIAHEGTLLRLRDMRGLQYLARLLREPTREFHASELVAPQGGLGSAAGLPDDLRVDAGLGDAGPILDARARAAYRARLGQLRDELEEAEHLHDLGRAERAGEEIAALRTALGEAARHHGAASHGERARLSVTKAIKVALERIDAQNPALGAHLNATVRRGYYCVYLPDPRHPIVWGE